jgi:hypothetical protein
MLDSAVIQIIQHFKAFFNLGGVCRGIGVLRLYIYGVVVRGVPGTIRPPGVPAGYPLPHPLAPGGPGGAGGGGGPVIIFALRVWACAAPASADQISCDVCH